VNKIFKNIKTKIKHQKEALVMFFSRRPP